VRADDDSELAAGDHERAFDVATKRHPGCRRLLRRAAQCETWRHFPERHRVLLLASLVRARWSQARSRTSLDAEATTAGEYRACRARRNSLCARIARALLQIRWAQDDIAGRRRTGSDG